MDKFIVSEEMVAAFQGKTVHPVLATFALGQQVEWATRQFILDLLQEDEEGVGTHLTLDHQAPAFVEEVVIIESRVDTFTGNELICTFVAAVGERIIARGKTGQKIFPKSVIEEKFNSLRNG